MRRKEDSFLCVKRGFRFQQWWIPFDALGMFNISIFVLQEFVSGIEEFVFEYFSINKVLSCL